MKPDIATQKSLVRVYLPSIHVRWGRSLHFEKQGSGMALKRAATFLLLHGWVAVGRNSSWLPQLPGLPHNTVRMDRQCQRNLSVPREDTADKAWSTSLPRES